MGVPVPWLPEQDSLDPNSGLHHPVPLLTLILVDSDSKLEKSREKQCPEKDQKRQRSPDLASSPSSVRSRSRNSRKHLVSLMSTRMASSLLTTSKLPLSILDDQSQMQRQTTSSRGSRTHQLHSDGHPFCREDGRRN